MSPPWKPEYDPELAVALKAMPFMPPLNREDLPERRAALAPFCTLDSTINTDPEIIHEERMIPGPDGLISISILHCRRTSGASRPGIYWMHGGGMIFGNKFMGIEGTFDWVKELDAVLISVEYRLAPEHPDPAPIEDCYAGLIWVSEHVSELGIDPTKLIIAGNSAGGGLAAGLGLLVRDRGGPEIFAQCLIYPMIDDRMATSSSKQFMEAGTWSGETNVVAWDWLLPGRRFSKDVSIYAAPARATDLSGLPQTWIDVGAAEVFRDEDIAYASKLAEFGVPVELHVWPGGWHAFDIYAPGTTLSKICLDTRMAWFKRILKPQAPKQIPAML